MKIKFAMGAVVLMLLGIAASPNPVDADLNEAPAGNIRALQGLIALGELHSCAVIAGEVKCWGINAHGQLGDGSLNSSSTPVSVLAASTGTTPLAGVTVITAGRRHTCALLQNTEVKCWGSNTSGQLGDGSLNSSSTPVSVLATSTGPVLSGVTAITASRNHTCALLQNTEVKCWGSNTFGQLGDRSDVNSSTPVSVLAASTGTTPLAGVTAITAGGYHTCALLQNSEVKCWGDNQSSQLGTGSNSADKSVTPVNVLESTNGPALNGITAITAGEYHTCALLQNSEVKCWGDNNDGRLGDGDEERQSTPVNVKATTNGPALNGITAITAGAEHTCALMQNTEVKCWGENGAGKVGNGDEEVDSLLIPTNVVAPVSISSTSLQSTSASLTGAKAVTTGDTHTCAIVESNLMCWGFNSDGQLGNGESGPIPNTEPLVYKSSATPVRVLNISVAQNPEPEQNETPAPAVTTTVAPTTTVKAKVQKADTLPATGSSTSAVAMFGVVLLAGGAIIAARKRVLR